VLGGSEVGRWSVNGAHVGLALLAGMHIVSHGRHFEVRQVCVPNATCWPRLAALRSLLSLGAEWRRSLRSSYRRKRRRPERVEPLLLNEGAARLTSIEDREGEEELMKTTRAQAATTKSQNGRHPFLPGGAYWPHHTSVQALKGFYLRMVLVGERHPMSRQLTHQRREEGPFWPGTRRCRASPRFQRAMLPFLNAEMPQNERATLRARRSLSGSAGGPTSAAATAATSFSQPVRHHLRRGGCPSSLAWLTSTDEEVEPVSKRQNARNK